MSDRGRTSASLPLPPAGGGAGSQGPADGGDIVALARQAAGQNAPLTLGTAGGELGVQAWVLHDSQRLELVATERWAASPARARGEARTLDPASFLRYVRRLESRSTTVWVCQSSPAAPPRVTAVLNDHHEGPGWRDHRVVLDLAPTPLWAHWVGQDGELLSQLDFAEHVEDGIASVMRPPAAELLEIAQTFHATRSVNFSSATRVSNGEVQLRWHEDTQASAGRAGAGSLEVPDRFVLVLEPWPGAGRVYEVAARLRWRLHEGQLRIGYRLDRVDEVIGQAVTDLTDHLVAELPDRLVLCGAPPAPLVPVTDATAARG